MPRASAKDRRRFQALIDAVRVEHGHAMNEHGAANERRLMEAVERLRAARPWMRAVRMATKEEDVAGCDVCVELDVGRVYLQAKSSQAGVAKWERGEQREMHVLPVIVSLDDSVTDRRAADALEALRERLRVPPPPPLSETRPKTNGKSTRRQQRAIAHAHRLVELGKQHGVPVPQVGEWSASEARRIAREIDAALIEKKTAAKAEAARLRAENLARSKIDRKHRISAEMREGRQSRRARRAAELGHCLRCVRPHGDATEWFETRFAASFCSDCGLHLEMTWIELGWLALLPREEALAPAHAMV